MKIRFKILAIAYILLLLFGAAVGASALLQQRIREELGGIVDYHVPITSLVADFDASTNDFELELRRMAHDAPPRDTDAKLLAEHIDGLAARMTSAIERSNQLLARAVSDPRNNLEDRLILSRIQGALGNVRGQLPGFVALGRRTMALMVADRRQEAEVELARFPQYDQVFGSDLQRMRSELEAFTQKSMREALENEQLNLWITISLFAVAAAIGLLFSITITGHIIGALRRLVSGTQAIERGELTEALPVKVEDEIGQLTRAFNRMIEELRAKEQIRDTFGRFVDPRIVSRLIERAGDNPDAAERRLATIFFSDIKGFSAISEQITPAAMVNLLNRYFTLASAAVRDHHGIVDKYIGDAVMAFWTQPFSASDAAQAEDACRSALGHRAAVVQLRRELPDILGLRRNAPDVSVRMGLATGDVVVGTVGSAIAKSYTVIGDTVNLASRLEGLNKAYGTDILVAEATEMLARAAVETREIDTVIVAGKSEPIRVFELLSEKGKLDETRCALRDAFEEGLGAYRARDWERAAERFAKCLAIDPKDGPSAVFARRVEKLAADPPQGAWDGVWRATEK
ncbi:MAG: HAMP domain-containing protein [Alphaproteobacteria bacterium]|nr:HAMP domain-containing protein [Alphaproteobacteria bacterium]